MLGWVVGGFWGCPFYTGEPGVNTANSKCDTPGEVCEGSIHSHSAVYRALEESPQSCRQCERLALLKGGVSSSGFPNIRPPLAHQASITLNHCFYSTSLINNGIKGVRSCIKATSQSLRS